MDLDIHSICIPNKDDTACQIYHWIPQQDPSLPSARTLRIITATFSRSLPHHARAVAGCPRTGERRAFLCCPMENLVKCCVVFLGNTDTINVEVHRAEPASLNLYFSLIRSLRSSIDLQSSIPRLKVLRKGQPSRT